MGNRGATSGTEKRRSSLEVVSAEIGVSEEEEEEDEEDKVESGGKGRFEDCVTVNEVFW